MQIQLKHNVKVEMFENESSWGRIASKKLLIGMRIWQEPRKQIALKQPGFKEWYVVYSMEMKQASSISYFSNVMTKKIIIKATYRRVHLGLWFQREFSHHGGERGSRSGKVRGQTSVRAERANSESWKPVCASSIKAATSRNLPTSAPSWRPSIQIHEPTGTFLIQTTMLVYLGFVLN